MDISETSWVNDNKRCNQSYMFMYKMSSQSIPLNITYSVLLY